MKTASKLRRKTPARAVVKTSVKAAVRSVPAAPRRAAKRSGLFLTFEGGEGAGKTTQIARLARAFEEAGRKVVVTREPGGSAIANRIRSLLIDPKMKGLVPLAELFLFEASRAQHVNETIRPAIAEGCVVICDRFADSSIVYQGAARGIEANTVRRLNEMATGGLEPDLTFVLDLDPRIGLARAGSRGILDRMEKEALSFHQAVRAGYLALAKRHRHRCRVIDASRSRDAIQEQIAVCLEGHLS